MRDTGAKTEYEKIVNERWGDWFFYGHADHSETSIARWWLVNLEAFRDGLGHEACGHITLTLKSNHDGTYFWAFDLWSFTGWLPILIASSHPLP